MLPAGCFTVILCILLLALKDQLGKAFTANRFVMKLRIFNVVISGSSKAHAPVSEYDTIQPMEYSVQQEVRPYPKFDHKTSQPCVKSRLATQASSDHSPPIPSARRKQGSLV